MASYRSAACKLPYHLPYSNHQDKSKPATNTEPKHDGSCTEFLKALEKMYTTSKFEDHAFEKFWFSEHGSSNKGLDERGLRMRVCVGPNIPFTEEDYKNGRNENENVCEGEVITIDSKEGWTTIEGCDGNIYRLSSTAILSFE